MSHLFESEVNTDDITFGNALRTPDENPDKPVLLRAVGDKFMERYEEDRNEMYLNRAISVYVDAMQLTPDGHADKPIFLNILGNSLLGRFEHLGCMADIHEAIATYKDAVRLTPDGHADKLVHMHILGLGHSLLEHFKPLGDVADVRQVIAAHKEAMQLSPDRHWNKPARLSYLGGLFVCRFERLGDVVDVERAIAACKEAVQLTPDGHPDKPNYLNILGNSLQYRFERLGDVVDVDMSIAVRKNALQLIPNKPGFLNNLGSSFMHRFRHLGDVVDIEKAIVMCKDAVKLTPDRHPDKPTYLSNLGTSFVHRFQHLGDVADVDKAIAAHKAAVQLIPDGHPNKYNYLNNLGNSLQCRFERLGDMVDVDKAIVAHKEAGQLIPDGHTGKPESLNDLGVSLQYRFEHLGDVADIRKAIAAQKDAVQLTPDGHANKTVYLNSLGDSFTRRFKRLGDVADVHEALAVLKDAVQLTPNGHADKPARLSNYGNSLQCRFQCFGDVADVDKAIAAYKDAVQHTPDGHANKTVILNNLGNSLLSCFERFGDDASLNEATLQFSRAACSFTGSPALRFRTAVRWAECSVRADAFSKDAYSCALDLLPRVAWVGLPMADRHRELVKIGDFVRHAAVAAIHAGKYGTALEWLEQGRSIVWGQLLDLRSPIEELHEKDPALADRLKRISNELEHASTRDISDKPIHQLPMEEAAQNHRRLALDYEKLVERARAVPGFEEFLRPKKLSQLRSAARSGPVVVINIHRQRCDALILMADLDHVKHVPLDDFSYGQAQALHNSLDQLLSDAGLRIRSQRDPVRVDPHDSNEEFKTILSELWLRVVKPVLESLDFTISREDSPPRIWWCPTGPLTFLPLHAAGLYERDEPGFKISDFFASSYTPTLTALLDTRPARADKFQLLAIAQPYDLPGTKQDLALIQKRAGELPIKSLEGVEATVGRVKQGMKECSWIHLACHGTQKATEPTKSALILHKGRLELSEIIKTHLPHAEFVFLSACQTATGDKRLSEEAVHLAAGMLLAGYRSVVATTWSIKDNDAPLVADEVYARLFKNDPPDPTQAAHALHHAVRRLRERN